MIRYQKRLRRLTFYFDSAAPFKYMGVEPKIGGFYPQNGWLIMENPNKMDDLGGPPLFLETPI